MQVFKHILLIIKIRVIDMVVQGQPSEICKIPGVLWPALYGTYENFLSYSLKKKSMKNTHTQFSLTSFNKEIGYIIVIGICCVCDEVKK